MDALVWKIGDVKVTGVVETEVERSRSLLFPDFEPAVLQDHPWLTSEFMSPGGLGRFSVHSYVRKSFGRRIVIDTCYGNGKVRRYSQTGNSLDLPFLADLQRTGYPVGAIDTVVCTHLHSDHVGWNTRIQDGKFVAIFPNARHLISSLEYDCWRRARDAAEPSFEGDQAAAFSDSIAPLVQEGLVDQVDGEYWVTPEVAVVPAPGHSPGHSCVRISSQGREAWITGDSAHHPIQLIHPEWGFPEITMSSRLGKPGSHCGSGALINPSSFLVAIGPGATRYTFDVLERVPHCARRRTWSGRRRLQVAAGAIMRRRVNERLRGRKRGGAG